MPSFDAWPPILVLPSRLLALLLQVHPDQFGLRAVYAGCDLVPSIRPTKHLLWVTFRKRWLYDGIRYPQPLQDVARERESGCPEGEMLQ